MHINPALAAPSGMVHFHIRIPRDRRAELHFYLEASDGLGYLEEDGAHDLGVVHTPPELEAEMLAYLQSLRDELHLAILKIEYLA